MPDEIKRNDQIKLLEIARDYTDNGEWKSIFSYPNCGWDLVQMGLVTEDKKIIDAGRATLWLLGKGKDPTDSKSSITINMKLNTNER